MSKKKKFLTVYTVSYTAKARSGIDCHVVSGSFMRRGDAIRACAMDVMRTVGANQGMKRLFMADGRVRDALKKCGVPDDMIEHLSDDFSKEEDEILDKAAFCISDMLVDVIGGDGCISFGSDLIEFRFDVDENDVVSRGGLQLWTCITSGIDMEDHDDEWECPFPEPFLSEEDAVGCALDDLRQCLEGHDNPELIMNEARESIKERGYYEYELSESKSRRWDIWSTPLDIGDGAGRIQRP